MRPLSQRETILFITVIVALITAEGMLELKRSWERRIFSTQHFPLYSFELQDAAGHTISSNRGLLKLRLDPNAGFVTKPDTRTPYFSINKDGFRAVPHSEDIAPSATVAILGGSTAFSTGASRDSTTYASYLAQELKTVKVINAATIGHTSANELGVFTSRLTDSNVRVLLSLTGWNDYQQWQPTQPNAFTSQIEGQLLHTKSIRDGDILIRYPFGLAVTFFPALYERVKGLVSDEVGAALPGIGVIREPALKIDPIQAANYFIENRKKLHRIAVALDVEACAILQPDLNALSAQQSGSKHSYNVFRREVLRQAAQENMVVFDAGIFPSPLQPQHFTDAIHLSDEGNKVLAEYTLPFIRSCISNAQRNKAPTSGPSTLRE